MCPNKFYSIKNVRLILCLVPESVPVIKADFKLTVVRGLQFLGCFPWILGELFDESSPCSGSLWMVGHLRKLHMSLWSHRIIIVTIPILK